MDGCVKPAENNYILYIAFRIFSHTVLYLSMIRTHLRSDAIDLGVVRGVRHPCYSTPCIMSSGKDAESNYQHAAPIIQVSIISAMRGVIFLIMYT